MSSSKNDDAKRSAGAKRWLKGAALLATSGWLVAGLLIADRMHARTLTGSLHNALVRSQTERHELTQELERMSGEMEALRQRLSRYRERQT